MPCPNLWIYVYTYKRTHRYKFWIYGQLTHRRIITLCLTGLIKLSSTLPHRWKWCVANSVCDIVYVVAVLCGFSVDLITYARANTRDDKSRRVEYRRMTLLWCCVCVFCSTIAAHRAHGRKLKANRSRRRWRAPQASCIIGQASAYIVAVAKTSKHVVIRSKPTKQQPYMYM